MKRSVVFAFSILVGALAQSNSVRAESSEWNLHLDIAPGIPLSGLGGLYGAENRVSSGGITGNLAVDWQLAAPFALELIGGVGYFALGPAWSGAPWNGNAVWGMGAFGFRFRTEDNQEGYSDEMPSGDILGNAWFAAHAGYHRWDGDQFGLDLGLGYEWSVVRPMQLGIFARLAILFGGRDGYVDSIAQIGMSASFELAGDVSAVDGDHDGLSDERERNRYHTDPARPDTDADGINDGDEVRFDYNPLRGDSDSDGIIDGREDANRNGNVDAGETDPQNRDSDGGGSSDGFESSHEGYNAHDRSDDDRDHDGVADERDQCLGTAPGTEVDERGCAVIRAQIVIEGIEFGFDSADILPQSEPSLLRALQILVDNPTARVEIAGHTDAVGTDEYNHRLSRNRAKSVRDWLVSHGVDRARTTVQGYGATQPRAANDNEENRARNRRIEFRVQP